MRIAQIENTVRRFALVAALALPLCMGCAEQPDVYPVSGTVLIDGEPLPLGVIRFVPESGRPASSPIMLDGHFTVLSQSVGDLAPERGLPAGRYKIGVSACEIVDEQKELVHWLAPRRYSDFRTSGLEIHVDGSSDNVVIDLTWDNHESTMRSNGSK
jgi:hypothetical protein